MKNKKAFTLIELLLVVGVVAVISMSIYYIYRKTSDSQKIQEGVELSTTIFQKVDAASAASESYENFDSTTSSGLENLIKSGVIPGKYINGNTFTSPFGTAMDFSVLLSSPSQFRISYPDMTPGLCIRFSQATEMAVDRITINSVVVKSVGKKLDFGSLQTQCLSGDKNIVMLVKQKPAY